jgi:RNA polymerase sigma-54 factor
LVRIAKQIIEEQKEFFLSFGSAALKPLTLKQVAEKLNVHESTVSRATANKYIATPFGLFELKKFFSSKISQENISSEYVKNRVQEFIVQEDKTSPLSDSEIAHLIFQKYGVKVARRTVAKYREALKIAPAQQRKCHYQINL